MVMEFRKEQMVIDMKVCGMQARRMDRANVTMLMGIIMKGNG